MVDQTYPSYVTTSPRERAVRRMVRLWLAANDLRDEIVHHNIRPTWLKSPHSNARLELDVFLPKLRFAIEFNGASYHSDLRTKERDAHKKRVCYQNKVQLYVIPGWSLSHANFRKSFIRLTNQLSKALAYRLGKSKRSQTPKVFKERTIVGLRFDSDLSDYDKGVLRGILNQQITKLSRRKKNSKKRQDKIADLNYRLARV